MTIKSPIHMGRHPRIERRIPSKANFCCLRLASMPTGQVIQRSEQINSSWPHPVQPTTGLATSKWVRVDILVSLF